MEFKKQALARPRIALLAGSYVLDEFARSLIDEGYAVDLFSTKVPKEQSQLRVHPVVRPFQGIQILYQLLKAGKRYTLYHAHSAETAFPMKLASWFTRVPTVLTVHRSRVFDRRWTLQKCFDHVMLLETRYSRQISLSEQFLKARNVNAPVVVIPPGRRKGELDELKSERSPQRFELLFVGRLSSEMGVDTLLKAVAQLVRSAEFIQSRKDFRLHVVSQGGWLWRWQRLAKQLNISAYVQWHVGLKGKRLQKLYAAANLFVLPSRFDVLPELLLEAARAGLPILATNVGDHRRFVLENTNGHLVPPGDVDELRYYLERFALNPHLEQMGQASRDVVEQEYAWETMVEKNRRVYERVQTKEERDWPSFASPWSLVKMRQRQRALSTPYRGKKPLRFCLTANLCRPPHGSLSEDEWTEQATHFLQRWTEFCATSKYPSTLFVEASLLESHKDALRGLQHTGHEIGLYIPPHEWDSGAAQATTVRRLREQVKAGHWKKIQFVRSQRPMEDDTLTLLHEHGFDFLPTTEDPLPHVRWRYGLPTLRPLPMDLEPFLAVDDEALAPVIRRLQVYQHQHGIDPYLIFECRSWEFQSQEDMDYPSGENFTALSKRLTWLNDAFPAQFLTLSAFYESCKLASR